ncbi:hypothetical protein B0H19DRAFT_918736, partial [Mycena capillaripes]
WIGKKYGIHHIQISHYNSRVQEVTERRHYPIREALIKACENDMMLWTQQIFYVFWAERVSISKATGRSLYWMAHGVPQVFVFALISSHIGHSGHPSLDDSYMTLIRYAMLYIDLDTMCSRCRFRTSVLAM